MNKTNRKTQQTEITIWFFMNYVTDLCSTFIKGLQGATVHSAATATNQGKPKLFLAINELGSLRYASHNTQDRWLYVLSKVRSNCCSILSIVHNLLNYFL